MKHTTDPIFHASATKSLCQKALTPTEVGMHKSRRTSVKNLVLRGIEKQESQSLNFTTGTEDTNNTPSMKRGGSKSNLRRGASFQRVTRSMSAL